METPQTPADFSLAALESLRNRLLDLSGRNRLLNYTIHPTASLQIVDKRLDQLLMQLLADEEMRFWPVPEPTRAQLIDAGYVVVDAATGAEQRIQKDPSAEQWAQWLSANTREDTTSASSGQNKHSDHAIQTLLFPHEMETNLRTIRNKAETAIEETGANILYLTFGFLQWYEIDNDSPRLAPLYLAPVHLHKGKLDKSTGTYFYSLTYSGEDILPNLSLREKLRIDFGLGLPDLDDSTTPEAYFAQVTSLIEKNQPRWRLRRTCALTLLNFGKLLMYLDLDPKHWPDDTRNITQHATVRRFFAAHNDSPVGHFTPEYDIDQIEQIHARYPLIDDADSSQHSALIDAMNGEDLVIEGPPGAGKSQTITNMIACALAQGKKVLFVAEKLAALEVVKNRLDNAGLGDFCLELHSHKTQKRKVLKDINRRILNQNAYREPSEIDADIKRYEQLKQALNAHAEGINATWKNTGKTIHNILMTATRYREQLHVSPMDLHPQAEHCNGELFTPDFQRQSLDVIRIYQQVYQAITHQLNNRNMLHSHPWFGVSNQQLQLFDTDRVCEKLADWQTALTQLNALQPQIDALSPGRALGGLHEWSELQQDLTQLPVLQGSEALHLLPMLQGEALSAFTAHIAGYQRIRALQTQLTPFMTPQSMTTVDVIALQQAQQDFNAWGVAEHTPLPALLQAQQQVQQLDKNLRHLQQPMQEIAARLGPQFAQHLTLSAQGLAQFATLLQHTQQLNATQWSKRNASFDQDDNDVLLDTLQEELQHLQPLRALLQNQFNLENLPSVPELKVMRKQLTNAGLLRWMRPDWWEAREHLLALSAFPDAGISAILPHLSDLIAYSEHKAEFDRNSQYRHAFPESFQGLDTNIEDMRALRDWYKAVRQCYGIGFGPHVALGDALLSMPVDVAKGMQSLAGQGVLTHITQAQSANAALKQCFSQHDAFMQDDQALIGDNVQPLMSLQEQLAAHLSICQTAFHPSTITCMEITTACDDLLALHTHLAQWHALDLPDAVKQSEQMLDIGMDDDARLQSAQTTVNFAQNIADCRSPALREAIIQQPTVAFLQHLTALAERLQDGFVCVRETQQQFTELTALDLAAWLQNGGDAFSELIARNQLALRNPKWLDQWLDFVRNRQRAAQFGFNTLLSAVEAYKLDADQIESGYFLGVYDRFARDIFQQHPELSQFSGRTQQAIQQQFREYDEKLKLLQRERIAWQVAQNDIPPGRSGGKVGNYTELALLKHESGKKIRHIPIRQLVRRAGAALAALKPCFMMGPMSVAQYLAPGHFDFDLIIIDEASQVRPEDALGAIARGKQLVVVGDPKQLPPTSFFTRIIENEDDDAAAIEESQSILDAAMPLFTARRLRWHYRSQHAKLIEFSNHAFYDGNLIVFPSPHDVSDEFGVHFTHIPRGRFTQRRNLEEAQTIAQCVAEQLLQRPHESLGVVAMSADQREHIERAVESLSKRDAKLEAALEKNRYQQEPFFIKNLENVQGDERDVIFISFTYGPKRVGGKLPQRFGPINSNVGWRRLNVLFTRSKKRMQVFSSMTADQIQVTEQSSRGVQALRDFLSFAERGELYQQKPTANPVSSDFSSAIANALQAQGFDCVANVGVTGLFLDIAVKDKLQPNHYAMGIECDGEFYHSAKSARDRDRLRQSVLERLGWRMHRIWTIDWFKDPQSEIARITAMLNDAIAQPITANTQTEPAAQAQKLPSAGQDKADQLAHEDGALQEKLERFADDVIAQALPETPAQQRLLRPAMISALLEFVPTSLWEFEERMPTFLLQGTQASEQDYLDAVFEIISASVTEPE